MTARVDEITAEVNRIVNETGGIVDDSRQSELDAMAEERTALEAAIDCALRNEALIRTAASDPRKVERSYEPPTVIRRPDNIYDLGAVRQASRTDEEFYQGVRDNAMRVVEAATFPHPQSKREDEQHHMACLRRSTPVTRNSPAGS
jgi:hypothetical protein